MAKFRIGVVGAGMGAKPHGQALVELRDQIEVAGVWTRSAASREAFGATYGFPVVDRLEALTEDPTVDAILVLTPPNARVEIVRAAAAAGKHVLTEKPIERTVEAGDEIVQICRDAGVRLGVVFQHRYRLASQELRRLLDEGEIGQIQAVRVEVPWWRPQSYYNEPGRGTYARDGGGVLISQAIHTLDLMLSVTGPVKAVQALAATTGLHRMESEDFVAGGLEFESGAVGSLFATTAAYPGGAESLRLDCDNGSVLVQSGTIRIDWQSGRIERRGEEATTGGGADPMAFPCDWHRDLIAGFAFAVRAGRDPVPSGADAVAVQRLISALTRSSSSGRRIALADL